MPKYVMDMEITGKPEDRLENIAKGVNKVASSASTMEKSLAKAGDAQDSVTSSAKTMALDSMSSRFEAFANKISEAGTRVRQAGTDFVKSIVSDAATFEDAEAEMRFAFGKDWQSVMSEVKKDAADLTFTFEETSRLASSLGRMKVNPFGGTEEASQVFKSKTGESIRALAVLQDTADAVGKSADDVVVSVRNAMSGSWKSLQDRFDIPKTEIAKWKKGIDALHEPQQKYNKLVQHLSDMFGGAGKEKALNWNKAIAQTPDLLQQIRAEVGKPGLALMGAGVRDFNQALTDLVKNKEVMKALQDGFTVIAQVLAFMARQGAAAIKWASDLVKAAPLLPRIIAVVALLTVGVGSLATGFLAVAGGIAAVGAAIMAIGWEIILPVMGVMLVALPLIAVAAGAVFTVMSIGADVVNQKWGGIATTFEKVKVVWDAMSELIGSYDGTSGKMSSETADKVQKMGLMPLVKDMFSWFHKAAEAWDEFKMGFQDLTDRLAPTMIPMLEEIGDLILELADAFGITDAATKGSAASTEDWRAGGRDMADTLGDIVEGLVSVIRFVTMMTRVIIRVGEAAYHIATIGSSFSLLLKIIEKVYDKTNDFLKLVGLGSLDKIGAMLGGGKHRELTHKRAEVEGANLPQTERKRIGAKYHSEDGTFIGAEEDQALTPEQLKAKYTEDDINRMARGFDPRAKAKEGYDYEKVYKESNGNSANYIGGQADNSRERGIEAANAKNIALMHQTLVMMYEHQKANPPSLRLDKEKVSSSLKEQNMSVAGGD